MTAILEHEVKEETGARGILTIPGGTAITWDPSDPGEVAVARQAFYGALKGGGYAVRQHPGGQAPDGTLGEVIREFEPEVTTEIWMSAQIVGG